MEGRISAIRIKRSRMKEGTFFFFQLQRSLINAGHIRK